MIYLVTNKINGKQYVGQTKSTLKARWSSHCVLSKYNLKHSILTKAIKKYGKDNFEIKILDNSDESQESRDFLERFYIKELETMNPVGYNLHRGGISNECPEKNKKSVKSYNTLSKEIKYYESAAKAERKLNLCRGAIHQAIKKQQRAGKLYWTFSKEEFVFKPHGLSKKVKGTNLITGNILFYNTISDAIKDGFSDSNIGSCLNGRYKQHKGYKWERCE